MRRQLSKQVCFAYADRDTANGVRKIAPGIIKNATKETIYIAQQRINQIISHGDKEAERVLPKILRGTIDYMYQTPFRLLRNVAKQQLNKTKSKILR